ARVATSTVTVRSTSRARSSVARSLVRGSTRVVRVLELVHLADAESRPLQIRRTRVDPRTRLLATLDRARDVDLTVTVDVATRAHRGHAASEIQPREALGRVAVNARTRGIEQMLVHHH